MLELMALIGFLMLFGLVCLALWVVLLPFYLLFRLLGFAVKVGLAGVFLVLAGVLLLPVMIAVAAVLFIPLLILAIPLLIAFAVLSWLVGFVRNGSSGRAIDQPPIPVS